MWSSVSNNEVIYTTGELPVNWGNISNLPALSLDILISHGWYPLEIIVPEITWTQSLGSISYDIQIDKVVGTYTVIDKSVDEITSMLDEALTKHLDSKAQEKRWTDRITCAVRAGFNNPWRVDATRFAEWMDICNVYGYQVMGDCINGIRTIPTPEEFILELPTFEWSE